MQGALVSLDLAESPAGKQLALTDAAIAWQPVADRLKEGRGGDSPENPCVELQLIWKKK